MTRADRAQRVADSILWTLVILLFLALLCLNLPPPALTDGEVGR